MAEPAGSSPSTPRPSYGRVAARGLAWTTGAVMMGRVTGFATSLLLGWLLAPSDFGIYAVAIGVSVVALTLRSAGIHRLLIQHGAQYDRLSQPFARLSLIINLAAMVLLGLIGPWVAEYFRAPAIVPLLWIIGLSMPLAVPAEILRARLAIDLRFRVVALCNAGAMFLTQLLTIGFAVAGLGPFSFALPMAIVAAIESIVLLALVGFWPKGRRLDWSLARELSTSTMWIVLCGFAAAMIVHGSNLVVGAHSDAKTTGLYYFGFQLTASVALFFSANLHRVLMPILTQLASEPRRQGDAYLKSIRVLAIAAAPLCGLGVAVAAPLIHFCWQGKWDASIPVFRPLTTVLPIYMMTVIGSALLEARGLWRANTLLHAASAVGTMAAAWIGVTTGGLGAVALSVAAFRAAFGVFHGLFMMRLLERPAREYVRAVLPPCILCAAAAWMGIFGVSSALDGLGIADGQPSANSWSFRSAIIHMTLLTLAYGLTVAVAFRVLLPSRVAELWRTVCALRRGPAAVTKEI